MVRHTLNAGDIISTSRHPQTQDHDAQWQTGLDPTNHRNTEQTEVQLYELEVGRTPVEVANRPVSFFSSKRGLAPCRCTPICPPKKGSKGSLGYHSYPLRTVTLRQVDDYCRTNAEAALLTDRVRKEVPKTPGYSNAKSELCCYCPGGVADPFRAKKHMTVNGLAYYELDGAYDISVARKALAADPSIARVALSPGGRGFHLVVPVVPEPDSVEALGWALKQVHGHLVCRYGYLFEKIDAGLTSGCELHYIAADPNALLRESALPVLTGAPPSRYKEKQRRMVSPGLRGDSPGELGPFQNTSDPGCLAWRDRTRRLIDSALGHLDLPDGSRNDTWIPIGFDLVGAELEGRAEYEVSIGARDIFLEWTRRAAYPGSTKPHQAAAVFDRLAREFDLNRDVVGSLESLYSKGRAAGWDGGLVAASNEASADGGGVEKTDFRKEKAAARGRIGSEEGVEEFDQEPQKRGRGRPKGSRNKAESAGQEKEPRQIKETKAVSDYVASLKNGSSDIAWLGGLYTLRNGIWAKQSPEFYEKKIRSCVGIARGTDTPLIGTKLMSDYMATLKRELLPAVVDTGLLAEKDRLRNFNIDSGELINGVAFENVSVAVDDFGRVSYWNRGEREFYNSSRPYELPIQDPGRPTTFDNWLEQMIPDTDTRQAVWEVLGMTVLAEGYSEQRLVFLCSGSRSGKGTLEKIASMLGGGHISFSGGPARLGAGSFTNSALVGQCVCIFPDSPPMPENPRAIAYAQYIMGLSSMKNLSGEDPITLEFKGDRHIVSMVWMGTVWWDTNHLISKVIPAEEDAHSWQSRLIPIPMTIEIPEDDQIRGFHKQFRSEVSSIAYHAIMAYAARRRRGRFTFSPEMQEVLLSVGAGQFTHLKEILSGFNCKLGAWTLRSQIREFAERTLGRPPTNKESNYLYRAATARGCPEGKIGGDRGFRNLCIGGYSDSTDDYQ